MNVLFAALGIQSKYLYFFFLTELAKEDYTKKKNFYIDIKDFFPCSFSESHIRDILRKSYGDEGLSSLRPNAVLNVPEGNISSM